MMQPAGRLPADLSKLAEKLTDQWTGRLEEMADILADETARTCPELPADTVRRLAVRLTMRQCQEYGGTSWYWLKVDFLERIMRNMLIYSEHDGTANGKNGIKALARRYRVSSKTIWAVIRQERARRQAKARQPGS